MTCGWHAYCVTPYPAGYGIDISAGAAVPVYSAIRAGAVRSTVEARVSLVTDDLYIIHNNPRFGARGSLTAGSCRRVEFIISDADRPSSGKPNRFQYVHVVGSVQRGAELRVPTTPGDTKLTPLGKVSADPWVGASGAVLATAQNHTWTTKRHSFRIGNATDGYRVYRVWRYVTGESVQYRSQPVFEPASPAAARAAQAEPPLEIHGDRKFAEVDGQVVRLLRYDVNPGNPSGAVEYYQQAIDPNDDFPDCIIDGSHLHQYGDRDPKTEIYGNKAFPAAPASTWFCSSVWMFKVQSSHSPEAQPPNTALEETCPARAAKTYTLTTSASGGGSISPSGVTSHKADGAATVTATWNAATHDFVSWSGPCKGFPVPAMSPATCVVSTDANKVVSATFRATDQPPPTTTPTAPAAPTNLTAEGGDGRIRLAWTDPEDSSISSYEYCTNTTAGADCTSWRTMTGATATTTRHTISLLANGSRLMNGTTYYVKIRALNSADASDPSDEESATPTATPPPPTASLTITAVAGDSLPGAWVNKAEQAAGFAISGSSEAGASVTTRRRLTADRALPTLQRPTPWRPDEPTRPRAR